MYFSNGNRYEGDWEKDNMKKGKLFDANGDLYEGDFRCEAFNYPYQRHGIGTLRYKSGNRYEGGWLYNQKHGKGTTYYASGNAYETNWINGRSEFSGNFVSKSELEIRELVKKKTNAQVKPTFEFTFGTPHI